MPFPSPYAVHQPGIAGQFISTIVPPTYRNVVGRNSPVPRMLGLSASMQESRTPYSAAVRSTEHQARFLHGMGLRHSPDPNQNTFMQSLSSISGKGMTIPRSIGTQPLSYGLTNSIYPNPNTGR